MSRLRFIALLLAPLLCLAGGATAQQKPPAAPTPATPAPAAPAPAATAAPATPLTLSVLVVDVQALLQNSKAAKMVRSQIEQRRTEYTKEISGQEEHLRAERDQLQRKQASMAPEALNQKGREFQQKVNDLDRSVQAKRQALEKTSAQALTKIQQEMLKIIAGIAKERKANLVLQRSELVLFDQSFDVTDEVLRKLDEAMPTLTVEFVAPEGAPAKPAPAAGEHERAAAPPAKPKHK